MHTLDPNINTIRYNNNQIINVLFVINKCRYKSTNHCHSTYFKLKYSLITIVNPTQLSEQVKPYDLIRHIIFTFDKYCPQLKDSFVQTSLNTVEMNVSLTSIEQQINVP